MQNNKYFTDLDKQHYLQVYGRYPLAIKKAKGCKVWDYDGNKYIDAFAGIAVNNIGHNHPRLVKAITKQLKKLIHISNFYVSKPQVMLAKKLTEISGLERAFFANSGAEANEGAIKLARKYSHSKGKGGTIISLENCFHGRTLATLATGKEKYQLGFEPIPTGFKKVAWNDITALSAAIDKETAGVILEVIQGEGGVNILSKEYLTKVRDLCNEKDIVLICDEVQCGMGRTGKFFAYEHFGIKPDIITLAKGLGGGMPIGAILTNQKIADAITFGEHGTTFGGNPLTSAAALETILILEDEKLLDAAIEKGNYFVKKLKEIALVHKEIKEIRSLGLMIGVELSFPGRELAEKMLHKGVLSNCTADNVIRFVPPLVISKKEMDFVLSIFIESLKEVKA